MTDSLERLTTAKVAIKALALVLLLATACQPRARVPAATWATYATPEEAGWSSEQLRAAEAFADSIGSAAYMLVYDGAVVATWGDIDRRYMCHSVRKSFLSGLYGIHVGEGTIDVTASLAELGIDDEHGLTAAEKQATVHDMLKARSGVYHPAAYETPAMAAARPERGSHAPNTFWYYNNWDFNTLNAIFEQETGTRIFEEFERRIADPIGMEDYRVSDCYYHLEPEHSIFPAYPFRMSARDMARYGLLYLRSGAWAGKQIIPTSWVSETSYPYSDTGELFPIRGGYGYMWWVIGGDLAQYGTYSALGVGTQTITVVPALDLVFVHRVDTYEGDAVPLDSIWALLGRLIDAKTGAAASEPDFVPLPEPLPPVQPTALPEQVLERYAGTYGLSTGDTLTVAMERGQLILESSGFGTFALHPVSESEFLMEDAEFLLLFETNPNGSVEMISEQTLVEEGFGFLRLENAAGAIETFKRMVDYFPRASTGYAGLGAAYQAAGNRPLAIENLRRALELDPKDRRVSRWLAELEAPAQ
jgi:CubicO group peptidase (beta-lactamase class C family)